MTKARAEMRNRIYATPGCASRCRTAICLAADRPRRRRDLRLRRRVAEDVAALDRLGIGGIIAVFHGADDAQMAMQNSARHARSRRNSIKTLSVARVASPRASR